MHFSTPHLTLSALLSTIIAITPTTSEQTQQLGPLQAVVDVLEAIGSAPPPEIIWTPSPSPECAAINQGELQCCQGSLAGDLPLIQFLAAVYGYKLNPNDVNGILCNDNLATCPGVKVCCQVTALNPLASLYCQDFK
ncbi:uncharacterized protein F4822DRAFT_350050 [Hypoxylon trugodes]|uniref:uncharacterized protein n=1 Tax=Hypoxylon trugodes TaxID=326681 RepID=UPI0021923489|nr:uncharacterized protein F4822DRAFT_350050 [Hypoxylon trugodes]KAI1385637.1 hypothetical protein F4822DRAFT_350050 [Hypoxylon trugodes]